MVEDMYRRQFENTTFTRWSPAVDKITESHPQGKQRGEAAPSKPVRGQRRRDAYKELWIKVQFRGGSEASWLITTRGRTLRFPGHMCLHDVLSEVAT